jgi:XTP/dITP diphosphohydrolase
MSERPVKLLVATTNKGKLEEIRFALAGIPLELASLADWPGVAEPEETGTTFAENARNKARYYARATGVPAVADDSGLEITALGGAPGVESARFDGPTYAEKFRAIEERFATSGTSDRTARFVCELALAEGNAVIFTARGVVEGLIAASPRGDAGFGYDPIFYYPPYGATLAEIPPAAKHAVSHRGQALRALRRFLDTWAPAAPAPGWTAAR